MKKKFLIVLLVATFSFSGCSGCSGCGKEKIESEETATTLEVITPTVVADEMLTEEGEKEDTGGPMAAYAEVVNISGVDVSVGQTSYKDMVSRGFSPVGEVDGNITIYENEKKEVSMETPDGEVIAVTFQGYANRPSILDGCDICGFSGSGFEFDLKNGITDQSTPEEIAAMEGFKEDGEDAYLADIVNGFDVKNGHIRIQFDENKEVMALEYEVDNIRF